MWPQFDETVNDPNASHAGERRPLAFKEIIEGMKDLPDLRFNREPLKFWLPESAEQALGEMAKRSKLSKSEFLRQFFAIHCYGLYAFYVMRDTNPTLFKDSDGGVFYQSGTVTTPTGKKRIETYWVPELGKNIAPVKVWIPLRLRNDLATLAQHAEVTLSNYVREILISRLLGQGMLPTRPQMFEAAPTKSSEDWNEGREVPMRQIDEADRKKYPMVATRDELVDE